MNNERVYTTDEHPTVPSDNHASREIVVIGENSTAQILKGFSIFLFVVAAIFSQAFSWGEVISVRNRITQIMEDRRLEQEIEACGQFYRNDLFLAIALSLEANNNMWVSVAQRDAALSDEQRIAAANENKRLGEELEELSLPLTEAIDSMIEYYDTPPPSIGECDHPQAARLRRVLDDA